MRLRSACGPISSCDDYVWGWTTRVTAPADNGPVVKASFRQSTVYGAPISLAKLKQRERGFVLRRTTRSRSISWS
jgi:hypothetical protein